MQVKTTEADDLKKLHAELQERRPLPTGRKQMNELIERVKAFIDFPISEDSIIFSVCGSILSLGGTEAYKEDGYFILNLRKVAANQVACTFIEELKQRQKERQGEAITPKNELRVIDGILEDQKV